MPLLSRFFLHRVPTGTGGGALADLQVEIFVKVTPLQPGHHRQHKVGLMAGLRRLAGGLYSRMRPKHQWF